MNGQCTDDKEPVSHLKLLKLAATISKTGGGTDFCTQEIWKITIPTSQMPKSRNTLNSEWNALHPLGLGARRAVASPPSLLQLLCRLPHLRPRKKTSQALEVRSRLAFPLETESAEPANRHRVSSRVMLRIVTVIVQVSWHLQDAEQISDLYESALALTQLLDIVYDQVGFRIIRVRSL